MYFSQDIVIIQQQQIHQQIINTTAIIDHIQRNILRINGNWCMPFSLIVPPRPPAYPSELPRTPPVDYRVETVQDFLIKLGIKPLMHLLEKSIFSLNNDLVRLTKIMNNLVKDLKILSFKVIFQCLKVVKSFQKNFLCRIFDQETNFY